MDQSSAHKALVLDFLKAFETGDLAAMDKVLTPNFRDLRPRHQEWSRHEFMRAMEVLFAARKSCAIDLQNLIAEAGNVAVEVLIRMDLNGEQVELAQHDLFLFEDQQISELHVYGDGSD